MYPEEEEDDDDEDQGSVSEERIKRRYKTKRTGFAVLPPRSTTHKLYIHIYYIYIHIYMYIYICKKIFEFIILLITYKLYTLFTNVRKNG